MNKVILLKAKFIGQDSLGYVNGEKYQLNVRSANLLERIFKGWDIVISRFGNQGQCAYGSLRDFLYNFEITKVHGV